jgi:acetyl-CoA synthetase
VATPDRTDRTASTAQSLTISGSAAAFLAARDFLLEHREDYAAAYAGFRWPALDGFNWALDYFDPMARDNQRPALWLVDEQGRDTRISFAEMSERSNRAANFFRGLGWRRGDRVLAMLPNVSALWEITLAAMKLGAVLSPATTLLSTADLEDRMVRGGMRHVVTDAAGAEKLGAIEGGYSRVVVGEAPAGWQDYRRAEQAPAELSPDGPTHAGDPFLLYFTSGTTAKPKMVLHTHQSYPVGHLSTMYWLGLRPGDVHLNISSPGWAKHAWSCFFAPWNAAATIFIPPQGRFDAGKTLDAIARCEVSALCAPPTVWRMLVLEDLAAYPVKLRELASAGEPLNPEVIARVRDAWGLTIRDGYGQTETTCQIGNSPGQEVKLGSMGRPMPGYRIELLDAEGRVGEEGEMAIDLESRPVALMAGYLDGPDGSGVGAPPAGGAYYRTSDVAMRDEGGYFWYVGRVDDVFKSSDYRISPFELESALIEHAAVAEAAVVPSPHAVRLSVPKAYVVLKPGLPPSREVALSILAFLRRRLAPYMRVRRLEFAELPKTVSGKIRRVQLRALEKEHRAAGTRGEHEYWEEDFRDAELDQAAESS